jgi:hypothetical protein
MSVMAIFHQLSRTLVEISLRPAAEIKAKRDRPVSFVQRTLLYSRIIHISAG